MTEIWSSCTCIGWRRPWDAGMANYTVFSN